MKTYYSIINLVFCFALLFASCTPLESSDDTDDQVMDDPNIVQIEAENFTASSDNITVTESDSEKKVTKTGDWAWIAFTADIPVPGRYKTEIRVSSSDTISNLFWVEDYVGNPDGRTYNITGNILLDKEEDKGGFKVLSKDGSPLDQGIHEMKIHIGPGEASVDWVRFSLIKAHQFTPDTLVQNTEGKEWKIVWSDEFEQDGLVDESKWTYDIGDWGWGNHELQYYTERRKENARVENGNLIIEAHKNDMGNAWTSARLTTRGKVTFLYGKIELRAKVPPNRGNWAAGWTLGDSYIDEKSWPYCGEIDILESVGYELDDETGNGKAHASAHSGAYYFKLNNQPTAVIDVQDMVDSFHTYAVEWLPSGIKAYVDDQLYFEYEYSEVPLAWPFDQPQNIILNLAMGGGWGGLQGMDETMTSQKYIIDYVRIYGLK